MLGGRVGCERLLVLELLEDRNGAWSALICMLVGRRSLEVCCTAVFDWVLVPFEPTADGLCEVNVIPDWLPSNREEFLLSEAVETDLLLSMLDVRLPGIITVPEDGP